MTYDGLGREAASENLPALAVRGHGVSYGGGRALQVSIRIHARLSMRRASRENTSSSRTCHPYFARIAARARAIAAGSVTMRAVASRHSPRMRPRASQGAMPARGERRSRLTLPDSPALNTQRAPSSAANQTGVRTSPPSRRKVARLR